MEKAIRFLILMLLFSAAVPVAAQQRKKVAVVLSGGGAKGMAHIGALKVIEEAGIPVDYIVGTSMGSIVGGLYAIGYTAEQLDSLVQRQDWELLLSDKVERGSQDLVSREKSERYIFSLPFNRKQKKGLSGLVQGENLNSLFADLTVGYHDSLRFDSFPIPFACVATDIVNGKEIVFHEGVLSSAMRASMAIPGVFAPVRKNGMVLVDGGLKNNYPADVAKAMGADVIIGVSVQQELLKAEELNKVTDILSQIVDFACREKFEDNIALTDLFIKVDTEGYTSASFQKDAIDTLIHRGETTTRARWRELKRLKKQIGVADGYMPSKHGHYAALSSRPSLFIKEIAFAGLKEKEAKKIMQKCRLKENGINRKAQIEQAQYVLREELGYSNVYYTLAPQGDDAYNLHYHLDMRNENEINVGMRFDSEENAALLLNAGVRLNTSLPAGLSLTGRLGERYMARLACSLEPSLMKRLNFSYTYRYNDIDVDSRGKRACNATYHQHTGEISFSDVWIKNFQYTAGIDFEYFKMDDWLYSQGFEPLRPVNSEHFFNYFISLKYNSYDRGYFPNKGTDFKATYTLYTDNFAQYDHHAPFSAVSASWDAAFSLNSRLCLLPSLYGRVLVGHDVAGIYGNALGGEVHGRYMSQQLSFVGITGTEMVSKSLLAARLRVRQRIGKEHYLSLQGNVAVMDDRFQDILKGRYIYAVGLGYGFNSKFGPLEASVGYTDYTSKTKCYINLGFYF